MKAMALHATGEPLRETQLPTPSPGTGQYLVEVSACAVCRTDLHIADGDLPDPRLPLVPGHEIVGRIVDAGPLADRERIGTRVGIPWLGWTCGKCPYCRSGRENLCDAARFTGYSQNGGFAEFTLADARFCLPVPEAYSDAEATPLLCAGLIGYRSLCKAGEGGNLGIYGFGAAAHIVAQVAQYQGRKVFAFTRPGDRKAQAFARSLGAAWAGDSETMPPEPLDAAILFAPVGGLVPLALKAVAKGGIVVCGGIHMSDIPSFPYEDLWQERTITSVANLTRADGIAFMDIAPRVPVRTTVTTYPLAEANRALQDLRAGKLEGAAVLRCR